MADHVSEIVTASDGERSIRVRRSGWQRDPPEEDGWYVAITPDSNRWADRAHHVMWLGRQGSRRFARSLSDGRTGDARVVSWWLVPGINLPPLPEEEP
jgi:hypothetical protein